MSTPFLAEVKIISFNYPPKGWAFCNGQILPINQNQALFALLGTTYGGDGVRTFALPNLQGNVPLHRSSQFLQGEKGGETNHTLAQTEIPPHTHTLSVVSSQGNKPLPGGNLPATAPTGLGNVYGPATNLTAMSPAAISSIGGQPHNNLQPYLVVNFIIALTGIFPSRN